MGSGHGYSPVAADVWSAEITETLFKSKTIPKVAHLISDSICITILAQLGSALKSPSMSHLECSGLDCVNMTVWGQR